MKKKGEGDEVGRRGCGKTCGGLLGLLLWCWLGRHGRKCRLKYNGKWRRVDELKLITWEDGRSSMNKNRQFYVTDITASRNEISSCTKQRNSTS